MYQYKAHKNTLIDHILPDFNSITFPDLNKKLEKHKVREPLISVFAQKEKEMVGLLLAEPSQNKKSYKIISFCVLSHHHDQGIGQQLLSHLYKILRSEPIQFIDIVFQSNWKGKTSLMHILEKNGWQKPIHSMILCTMTLVTRSKASWAKYTQLPEKYSTFLWASLTEEEKQQILEKQKKGWFPPALTPFQEEERLAYDISLGLKYNDEVVGWWINHWVNEDTLQRTCLFIDPDFRTPTISHQLTAIGGLRQMERNVPNVIFQVNTKNKTMMRYFDKFLRPATQSVVDVFWSRKKLSEIN